MISAHLHPQQGAYLARRDKNTLTTQRKEPSRRQTELKGEGELQSQVVSYFRTLFKYNTICKSLSLSKTSKDRFPSVVLTYFLEDV